MQAIHFPVFGPFLFARKGKDLANSDVSLQALLLELKENGLEMRWQRHLQRYKETSGHVDTDESSVATTPRAVPPLPLAALDQEGPASLKMIAIYIDHIWILSSV